MTLLTNHSMLIVMVREHRAVTLIVQSYNYYLISAVLLCGSQASRRFSDDRSGAFVGHQLLHRDLELGESGASCPSSLVDRVQTVAWLVTR